MSAKLAIIGISGRMGVELVTLAPEAGFQVRSGVALQAARRGEIEIVTRVQDLKPADVDLVIDFSLPELTDDVITWCETNAKPLVSGVTGISESQKTAFQRAARKIPVIWSSNMSLGIAVLTRLLAGLKALEGFDFQIEETHHNRKKDAPSGTALSLQTALKTALGRDLPEPLSIRGGGVFGIHRVMALGEEETLTLEHTALNRRVFARGALRASRWLISQKPGLYRLEDTI